jgi:hypothetical protein
MKNILFLAVLVVVGVSSYACPVCERAKAKILFGSLSHGTLPVSKWEYVAVWVVIISVVLTLFYSVKWLIKPSENNIDHIKYSILKFE